jgi:hypothetical protein
MLLWMGANGWQFAQARVVLELLKVNVADNSIRVCSAPAG